MAQGLGRRFREGEVEMSGSARASEGGWQSGPRGGGTSPGGRSQGPYFKQLGVKAGGEERAVGRGWGVGSARSASAVEPRGGSGFWWESTGRLWRVPRRGFIFFQHHSGIEVKLEGK